MKKIKVGLYGTNGHQIHGHLADHPRAELIAVAALDDASLPEDISGVRRYASLDAMLADGDVELVSLCSPLRSEQAGHAIACMRAGKHVYAEKPCAMIEADLDAVISTAHETGMQFHEMAGTAMEQPYRAMREAVAAGAIGRVVQVLAQKSYPWGDWRPADENVDGGLGMQVGVYVARFVEHVAGETLASLELRETTHGNPRGDTCRMAVSFLGTLENGGLLSAVCNYLNPLEQQIWGYEILRIFGTEGVVESNADGQRARLLRIGEAPRELDVAAPSDDYFDLFVASLQDGVPMPFALEKELSPTRWVIRARARRP